MIASYEIDSDNAKEKDEKEEKFSTIVRIVHNRENPYVQLNKKALWDTRLSLKATGLWARCMSRPNDWKFNLKELIKSCKEGRRSVDAAMQELILFDYVVRLEYYNKDQTGKFQKGQGGVEYVFFEFPATEEEKQEQLDIFKKSFRRCGFGDSRNVHLLKKEYSLKENTRLKKEKYAPSKDDAKNPVPKKEEKKERTSFVDESQYNSFKEKHGLLVSLSDSQHQKLIEKYGNEITLKAYQYLAEWKLSKAETEPKTINKHTDYYRITKWVIKEIKNDQQRAESKGITPEVEKNKEWAKKVDNVCSASSKFNAKYVNVREDGIQFLLKSAINGEDCFVKCTDKGFIEICKNYLRKMGLI